MKTIKIDQKAVNKEKEKALRAKEEAYLKKYVIPLTEEEASDD